VGRFDPDSGEWTLDHAWTVWTTCGWLRVEPGFVSDGASIPRFLWAIGPRYEASTFAAALAHDALYAAELPLCDGWKPKADKAFLDLLKRLGVGWLKRTSYFIAVSCFGGVAIAGHTDDTVAAARMLVKLEAV
jgi:hypothetical protein